MMEKDQNNAAHSPSDESPENVQRMSKDERMAFEKIISEIGENSSTSGADESSPGPETQPSDDAPNDDQQATLDKIMSEINGDGEPEAPAPEYASEADDAEADAPQPADELNDDQQAALDKIMGEINGDGDPETPAPENASEADDIDADDAQSADELDDEQQAALDKIMSEINGGGEQQTPAPEDASGEDDTDADAPQPADELNDDQQAALNKIMAEINGDGDDAPPEDEKDVDAQAPDVESDADDPDELESDAEDDASEVAEKRESEDQTDKKPPPAAAAPQLSLEEFNEELNNLLSAANANPDTTPSIHEPAAEDPSVTQEPDADENPSEDAPADAADDVQDYAILQEVSPNADRKPSARKTKPLPEVSDNRKSVGRILYWAAAAVLVICLGGGAYWYFMPKEAQPLKASHVSRTIVRPSETPGQIVPTQAGQDQTGQISMDTPNTQPGLSSPPSTQSPTEKPSVVATLTPLASLKDDINTARDQVIRKLEEVKDLKSYYEKGIAEDQDSIRRTMASSGIATFEAAQQHGQIELQLRTIQRRRRYTAKLDFPISQLTSASEELLFLKRKTDMFETLSRGLSGLSLPEFSQEVSTIIGNLLKLSNGLDIDQVQVKAPELESIWKEVQASKSGQPASRVQINDVQDRDISQEICRGDFERKYLLTTLDADTAKCLFKWSGKDLYLNALTQISPSAAETLSQWPGEWLSLNGLETLTPEAAKYLSQWKGKRLSLNGLKRLSKNATRYLSEWKGEQLEMVGLESIGRWENYGTRLYLSEKLRRKLQVQ
jgi:hypothetical protein